MLEARGQPCRIRVFASTRLNCRPRYNWLAARQSLGGKFVLRIEDTDQARSTQESEESMLADLEWLGLNWDEGPRVGGPCGSYRQSERTKIYQDAADFLVRAGFAYPCFCTEDELNAKRIVAKMAGSQVAYDGTWRDANPEEIQSLLNAQAPHTYRFRVPKAKVVSIDDKVRGRIDWDVQATIGDFILLRSNGVPVYNFCVAVDDALMGVTTVVRAEEHLTNTVRQLLVLEALGFQEPFYAHASLILGSDRAKLSKRHGATSCGQFRARGYLPDAMINYLALLGWNDGTDKEVYSRRELIEAFDLSRVTASPAMFDNAKLRWLNGQHLRAMRLADLLPLVSEHFQDSGLIPDNTTEVESPTSTSIDAFIVASTSIAQPKAELVTDITELTKEVLVYPFLETLTECANETSISNILNDDFTSFVHALIISYDAQEAPLFCYKASLAANTDAAGVTNWLERIGDTSGRSKKRLLMPARLALTGRTTGMDVPSQLKVIQCAKDAGCGEGICISLEKRIDMLRAYVSRAPSSSGKLIISNSVRSTKGLDLDAFAKLRQVYESNRRTAPDDATMFKLLKDAFDTQ